MIPAIILFALGVADWLTTRAILAEPGGYERVPFAKAGMARFGVTPFMLGKAAAMGGVGYAASLIPGGLWVAGALALIAAGFVVNNLIVLRRFNGRT